MSKQETFTTQIATVPFTDLYISQINPRQIVNEAGIEALAENIRQFGLIQNLAGLRDEAGRVGIVAGGRRLRALDLLQDDPRFQALPVQLAPDADIAAIWATSENHHREQVHAADEIREYAGMGARGASVAAIAVAFGVTEKHVYRRLALAALPAPVLDALRADEISLSIAAIFTISEDAERSAEVLAEIKGRGYSEHNIRQMLKPDAIRDSDRRAKFVGLEAYEAAGGTLIRDLFAETVYLDQPEVLETVFLAKLATEAEALCAAGRWKWAEECPAPYIGYHDIEQGGYARLYPAAGTLSEDEVARYDALAELAEGEVLDDAGEAELAALQIMLDGGYTDAQKAHAGVIVYVSHDGTLAVIEGLVRRADRAEAEAAGVLAVNRHQSARPAEKPLFTAALSDDLKRMATGARQHAAVNDPDLILDLLAFQISGRMGYRKAFGLRAEDVPNSPQTETGYGLDSRLTDPAPVPKDPWGSDLARSFREFRKKGAETVRGDLTRYLASLLTVSDERLAALIDRETKASIRAVWTPTAENFFARVGGPYLNALWRDLLGLAEDHPTVTTFAKLKKGEKAAWLESLFADATVQEAHHADAAAKARIAAWLPEGMA